MSDGNTPPATRDQPGGGRYPRGGWQCVTDLWLGAGLDAMHLWHPTHSALSPALLGHPARGCAEAECVWLQVLLCQIAHAGVLRLFPLTVWSENHNAGPLPNILRAWCRGRERRDWSRRQSVDPHHFPREGLKLPFALFLWQISLLSAI